LFKKMGLTLAAYSAILIPKFSAGLQPLAVKVNEILRGKGHNISGKAYTGHPIQEIGPLVLVLWKIT
jgi:hypothetical protein